MPLNSETGAVGAHLPSLFSRVPNFWSSTTPEKQSEKPEKIDSNTLSNGRKVSLEPPAESSAVATLAQPFTLSTKNRAIINNLSQKAYATFGNPPAESSTNDVNAKKTEDVQTKKDDEKDTSLTRRGVKWVGKSSGGALANMHGEYMLLKTLQSVLTVAIGPLGTFAAQPIVNCLKAYGVINIMANTAGDIGEALLPGVIDRGAALLGGRKPVEKNSDNTPSDGTPLSKVITFKEGKYFFDADEINKEIDFEVPLEKNTFYQICQQILNSDQAEDLFKTYVRTRDDDKLVLADGYVCSKEEAENLTRAGLLLHAVNTNSLSDDIEKAIQLLAKHYNPEKKYEYFYERYKPTDNEIFRKSIKNDLMIEMSDGTFGFEDDKGMISLIPKEAAEAMRAEKEVYVNYYVENYATEGIEEFVVLDRSEGAEKTPESFLASTLSRFTTGWLKA